ncbi:hypothetical protein ABNQ39_26695 [Azospirillum sp. A26]|uniref:ATP-binding protein n=1 Tax=Azospirillum sp. A26 TaxID=3160607 RepID=UPI00366C233E
MSNRLAKALVRHIHEMPGASKFILMEGISKELAFGIAQEWRADLPPLLVGSDDPTAFGIRALNEKSASTTIRNHSSGGVVVIACRGFEIPDWQSVARFPSLSPSDLLATQRGLVLLAEASRKVELDGPLRVIRAAILEAEVQIRPTAQQVADYFEAIAKGDDPLVMLPLIGGFSDAEAAAAGFGTVRLLENLRLAHRTFGDSPSSFIEIRKKADRLFQRTSSKPRTSEELVRLLQTESESRLQYLAFEEAKSVLDNYVPDLTDQVIQETKDYQRELASHPDGEDLIREVPWDDYMDLARSLKSAEEKKDAARGLLEFDRAHDSKVFQKPTKKKLESLVRERSIAATSDCLEDLLVRGALALESPVRRISLIAPFPPDKGDTRAAAQKLAVLACASFRLKPLLESVSAEGVDVDGALVRSPRELVGITDETLFAGFFSRTEVNDDAVLPLLQLRLHGEQPRDSVELRWRPSADDLASLRLAVEFSFSPCARLETEGQVTAPAFCGAPEVRGVAGDPRASSLATVINEVANTVFDGGLIPSSLRRIASEWTDCVEKARGSDAVAFLETLSLAGVVVGRDSVGLGLLSPLKAEWVASALETLREVAGEAILTANRPETDAERLQVRAQAAAALARATSCHYPAFIRQASDNRPLLPVTESRSWSAYSSEFGSPSENYAEGAVGDVIDKLLTLQPEIGGHLKCLAFGPGAASLLVGQALKLLGCKVGRGRLESCEIICVSERPDAEALAAADTLLGGHSRHLLKLRYFKDFNEATRHLPSTVGSPTAHLAVVTGLSNSVSRLSLDTVPLRMPEREDDVLMTPKTWVRPGASRRMLLAPPGVTEAGAAWLTLATAIEDRWPDEDEVRVPELNPSPGKVKSYLKAVHDMSLWVATVDRYASRDAIERAMGEDVAILHQERRLSSESPVGLVISQRSGGSADRAIARSLKSARIVSDEEASRDIGRKLREVASQGHGVLALEAATSGSGINELVAHVVSFSLLGSKATPWPLPPGCRVLLVSLDEYASWFATGKRADLLALALDKENKGVHVAAIEVKARRSDTKAEAEAIDQLRHTLTATQYAAYHDPSHLYTRVWLNRIADAAYSVAREIGFRLESAEIEAIEAFRRGVGVQEWAAIALVFGPSLDESERHYFHNRFGDRVPIAVHSMRLTKELLEEATKSSLINLRTVETEKGPLPGGRQRRRPERGVPRPERQDIPEDGKDAKANQDIMLDDSAPLSVTGSGIPAADSTETPDGTDGPERKSGGAVETVPSETKSPAEPRPAPTDFVPPILGWRMDNGEPVLWRSAGAQAELTNGHVEIWGSSGKGKTQFTMSLLAQLSANCGACFGIADFKNDYAGGFPDSAGARFIDLWDNGAPYNPLALMTTDERSIAAAIIEIRDAVDIAARTFAHMGHRQLGKLAQALETVYRECRAEGRWPTLKTLDDYLDEDLRGVIGDLTRHRLFRDGPPLGEVIAENVVFGLSKIPGTGLTTVLAGGFILSALLQKVMSLPQVSKQIRYVVVVDEAHRVAGFKSVHTMIREGRSKGLAVILATQQPSDLPQEVATNAQTKICFQLDPMMAKAAAKRLDPSDRTLPDQIRNLAEGEAFVSLGNSRPVLVRMAQLWRDRPELLIPERPKEMESILSYTR